MPRSSTKNKPIHPKRIHQAAEDGWTTIVTLRSRKPQNNRHSHTEQRKLEPAPIPKGCTLPQLQEEFARHETTWKNSTCHDALERRLRQAVDGMGSARLKRCVCVGLGSLSGERSRRISMVQLNCLRQCLKILAAIHQIDQIYAQDPVFNSLDEQLLATMNITVVQDPEAFDLIDETTFLLAPHCERSFLLPGLRGRDPLLVVANSFESLLNGPLSATISVEDRQLAQLFLGRRVAARFPDFEELPSAFNDLMIYWRQPDVKDDD
ncbi:MAG: hypothetical protein M1817_000622 [Caeruleum heppii]|nr:MAG: hypothetical protein M1817_000622 [Caeruleum heppii]